MASIQKDTTEKVSMLKALIVKVSIATVLTNITIVAKVMTGKDTIARDTITAVLIEKDTTKRAIPVKIGKTQAINLVRAASLF